MTVRYCEILLQRPHYFSIIYSSHWQPPRQSERMWSTHLELSTLGEYQTLGGHSDWAEAKVESPMTSTVLLAIVAELMQRSQTNPER